MAIFSTVHGGYEKKCSWLTHAAQWNASLKKGNNDAIIAICNSYALRTRALTAHSGCWHCWQLARCIGCIDVRNTYMHSIWTRGLISTIYIYSITIIPIITIAVVDLFFRKFIFLRKLFLLGKENASTNNFFLRQNKVFLRQKKK